MDKLQETFDGLDPEFNSMVAYQAKINELVDYCERLKKAVGYLADLSDIQFKSGEVNYNQVNQILTEKD